LVFLATQCFHRHLNSLRVMSRTAWRQSHRKPSTHRSHLWFMHLQDVRKHDSISSKVLTMFALCLASWQRPNPEYATCHNKIMKLMKMFLFAAAKPISASSSPVWSLQSANDRVTPCTQNIEKVRTTVVLQTSQLNEL